MLITRTTLVALAVAAAITPAASARVPEEPRPAVAGQTTAPTSGDGTRFAEIAAHHEAITNRQWELAENRPVVALSRPAADGVDFPSALIGGGALLMLVLLTSMLRSLLGNRRRRISAIAPS